MRRFMLKHLSVLLPWAVMLPLSTHSQAYDYNFADVNRDGEISIADVNAVIDMILGTAADNGDVNGDGEVNIADVNAVIDIILKS